ncbi:MULTISPECIES: MFS transporter [Pantoea]|jgi:predicted MFS family arabinose efflux permease|uniref:MFS transporter n=1 Tax=Pantoea brenneri TaxID=472694 RepID=A0A7Y6TTW9_9GAMM|nr:MULTISPECIES: MFS transporter [Pantoea]MBZ6397312.1 MFS transporter [Pantoea sp.]MBZ6440532.1 MFS transporter [Pantoea sp.]NUY43755.1 MFS transporter [Pantoea brenneri]NUY51292.1 MFS transporter [Pantoea brenneri]NUY61561.1 MFS transporter [Pantoea brenneri]
MNASRQGLTPALVLLMSVATGLSVASNYYVQPLLSTIAHQFDLSVSLAGFIVTTAQLGYACGLLLLVPLGDRFERRSLIVTMILLAAAGMVIIALSRSFLFLLLGTLMTGLFSVAAQILVPLAATLAEPERRGKIVGTVMSGLLLGILLARTVSGGLAQLGGWRTVYWTASLLMAVMALALWRFLPRVSVSVTMSYRQLLASIFRLYAGNRVIRTRAWTGCLSFANFSLLWTSMAFLLSAAPYHSSEGEIGLLGLVGAAGALAARQAGSLADKGKAKLTTRVGLLIMLLSWIAIALGAHSLAALIVGILLLDLAVQAVHITNQSVIYAQMPDARNRLNAGYMTSYFIGGAAGSLLSATAYHLSGWYGVCSAGAVLTLINLLIWFNGQQYEQAKMS